MALRNQNRPPQRRRPVSNRPPVGRGRGRSAYPPNRVPNNRIPYENLRVSSSGGKHAARRRNRGISFSVRVVAGLFFVFVLVYMARAAVDFISPPISTHVVRASNMEAQRSVQGIIIRDEQVFYADRTGEVVFRISDFDRVRAGVHVASIQDADAIDDINQESAVIEAMIMNIRNMRHYNVDSPQIERANENLNTIVNTNMHLFTTGNLLGKHNLYESLRDVTDRRNQWIIGENSQAHRDLGRSYENIQFRRAMSSSNIYATRTGIMSPIIDGAENRFTVENMRNLTREDLLFAIDHSTIIPSRIVEEGDPIFKIVGNIWYIAVHFSAETISEWEPGQLRTMFVQNVNTGNYEAMQLRIELIDYGTRDPLVIFRSTRNVMDFLGQRNVSIRTTDNVAHGLHIPSSAVATRNFYRIPRTHVFGAGDYYVRYRTEYGLNMLPIPVSESSETHVYVLVESIYLLSDDILVPVDPMGQYAHLTETVTIHGVYRANLGFAYFRAIHLEEELTDTDGFVLLNPARNAGIREFDTVVTDASMVTHGQVLGVR